MKNSELFSVDWITGFINFVGSTFIIFLCLIVMVSFLIGAFVITYRALSSYRITLHKWIFLRMAYDMGDTDARLKNMRTAFNDTRKKSNDTDFIDVAKEKFKQLEIERLTQK